jgi:hypothetical protein
MYQEDNKTSVIKMILRILLFILVFILAFKLITMAFNNRKEYLDNNNMSHNLNSLQNAAINYFKSGVLSDEDNSAVKVTLKDLIEKEYTGELKDEYKFVCSNEDSYVEALKTGNEYRIKTYLKCNNKSDYIFTYLDSDSLKEKKDEEPVTTTTTVAPVETTTIVTTTNNKTTTTTKKTTKVTTTTTTTTKDSKNTEPIVITTKPVDNRISVAYDCKGGTINGALNYATKVNPGETIVLPTPVKEGRTFYYWYDSEGNKYTGSIKVTKQLVLYAYWY